MQSDILYEILSVLEHLEVYADLKGLTAHHKKQQINYVINALRLDEFAQIPSEDLSGGNKRKLCVAISMMVSPILNFHD